MLLFKNNYFIISLSVQTRKGVMDGKMEERLAIFWYYPLNKLQIELLESSSLNPQCPTYGNSSQFRGSSYSKNGILPVRMNGSTSGNISGDLPAVRFSPSPGSEVLFSPSESSTSSSYSDHCLSITTSRLSSPVDLNGISTQPHRTISPSDVPFPWQPDLSTLVPSLNSSWLNESETMRFVEC